MGFEINIDLMILLISAGVAVVLFSCLLCICWKKCCSRESKETRKHDREIALARSRSRSIEDSFKKDLQRYGKAEEWKF